ncbi:uncharacterized protein LOC120849605 [Ixodes scapularis]|uniref:uncharacterized protein LOC120849605 n=1 Tax=Ixodes scapularis TaxID=6945 RepID=UPI001C38E953|nr:uncharacterized protein LOC120849605 [Ixodes scapularis]
MTTCFARASKAVLLLALCFIVVYKAEASSPQHTCSYPRACANPGNPDPSHTVTSTARYNPTTGQCETIPAVTGPHSCDKFPTLADCQKNCGTVA